MGWNARHQLSALLKLTQPLAPLSRSKTVNLAVDFLSPLDTIQVSFELAFTQRGLGIAAATPLLV